MNPQEIPLRDLHLPAPVGWWPPAPGWWLLLALAAGGLLWLGWYSWRHWAAGRARRIALREFANAAAQYRADGDIVRLAERMSALLRRTMLAYAPRAEIAGLTGAAWLNWLDRGLPEPLFTGGAGAPLNWLPYRGVVPDGTHVDADALLQAVRLRLVTPPPEAVR